MCPPGTVKCPGSYCIPMRMVCDASLNCPNGEDEQFCGMLVIESLECENSIFQNRLYDYVDLSFALFINTPVSLNLFLGV